MDNNNASRTFSKEFIISFTFIFSTTLLLVLLENILVIVAILSSRELRNVRSNLFLVGLSVADVFTSLTLIPFQLVQLWSSPNWPLGDIGVKIYNSSWNFCMIVPFLTVLAITLDRYLGITRPQHYCVSNDQVATRGRGVVVGLVFIWTYTVVWVSLLSLSFTDPPQNEYAWNVPYKYYYPYLGINVLVPLIIICYCYLKLLHFVKRTREEVSDILGASVDFSVSLGSSQSLADHQAQTEIKFTKTVGYIIIALVVVWIPVICLEIVYAFGNVGSWRKDRYKLEIVGIISLWLVCSNGIINPVIYLFIQKSVDTKSDKV